MLSKLSAVSFVSASYSGNGGYGSELKNLKVECDNFNGGTGCTDG